MSMSTVFLDDFVTNDELYDYSTRHNDNIHRDAIKTANGQRMIRHKGPAVRNKLLISSRKPALYAYLGKKSKY
jgi:hypothetical protein